MSAPTTGWTIGQVARSCDMSVETVRFYEKAGLLPKPRRRPSGYRVYTQDTARRLRFIQSAKTLGFSLAEIRELLALRVASGRSCTSVQARAQAKIDELDAKLAELNRMRAALVRLTAACVEGRTTAACPVLDALEAEVESHAEG